MILIIIIELWSDYFCNHVNHAIIFFNRPLIAVLMHILFVTFFNLFVLRLQVDVVGPLLLNASLLLVLKTDYGDWLVQVTQLTDNWQWRNLLSFDDCVIEELLIRSFNVEKRSISECLRSLLALLVRVIFSCVKIFKDVNFFNRD